MITKVTKENKGLYQNLFALASEKLGAEITSLDEYFNNIVELNTPSSTGEDSQKIARYSYLPIDEPTFEINANTREIIVPNDFKKYGISVKGDHYAEILYFRIDRYFETTDLYNDDVQIVIQWEDPNKVQGISKAVFKDVDIFKESGKLLFGWALNNTITKKSGSLKFAVRFYRLTNENDLKFNLSTLVATAPINASLDYDYNRGFGSIEQFVDDQTILRNLFTDSENAQSSYAEDPVYIIDLPYYTIVEGQSYPGPTTEDGYRLVDLDSENKTQLIVLATSSDGGKVSYVPKYLALNSENVENATGWTEQYRLTEDSIYDASKIYYEFKEVSGVEGYYQKTEGIEAGQPVAEGLYEKAGFGAVINYTGTNSVTGDYWVEATNYYGVKSHKVESSKVRIPGPAALSVTYPAGQASTLLLDGMATLSVTGSTEQTGDKIIVDWYANDTLLASQEKNINMASTYSISNVPIADLPTYDKTITAKVKSYRNGDSSEIQEFNFRVTDVAHEATVTVPKTDFRIYSNSTDFQKTISVEIDNSNMVSDNVTYQWYKETADETDEDELIEGATSASYIVENTSAYYYCKVTNIVNGSTATTDSNKIGVIYVL